MIVILLTHEFLINCTLSERERERKKNKQGKSLIVSIADTSCTRVSLSTSCSGPRVHYSEQTKRQARASLHTIVLTIIIVVIDAWSKQNLIGNA